MAKQKYAARTAKVLKKGIADAEKYRSVRDRPADGIVKIKPSEIKTQPELFQIREFSFGLKQTDGEHVKKLARAIGTVGELDPPVVIKIGSEWICVDGHHRIEAYKKTEWRAPIKCVWFNGSVTEAVDESMRLNGKDRLNVPQRDRLETAWKLVLLGDHSKAQIVELCCVGDGSVAHMRRVVKVYGLEGEVASKLFRKQLGVPLDEASWTSARLAFAGVEPKERDDEEEAAKLAKRINSRLTNRLSRDPRITARALALYDPDLPKALMAAWREQDPRLEEAEEDVGSGGNKRWTPLPKGWKRGDPLPSQ
jgi:hypothetical protein